MKKILITGASGFVGSNLLKDLSNSSKIYAIARSKKLTKINFNKNINFIYFKNHKQLNFKLKKLKIDIIIHCATHYIKHHKFSDINKIIKANIEFGNILLENLKFMNVKKFINFTTVWENYNGRKANPFNFYSASKISFNNFINYYSKQNNEVKFYNIYLSDTYGANDKRFKLINLIKKYRFKKNIIKISSKNLFVNLLNVKDIVRATRIVINKKIKPGNYNVINETSFKIFNLIKNLTKTRFKIKWLSIKKIQEKIYRHKKLPHWRPKFSSLVNLIKFIEN